MVNTESEITRYENRGALTSALMLRLLLATIFVAMTIVLIMIYFIR